MENNITDQLEWQIGRTAGEINLIRFVQAVRFYLLSPDGEERVRLLKEANWLLEFVGVET